MTGDRMSLSVAALDDLAARYRRDGWCALGAVLGTGEVEELLAEELRLRPRSGGGDHPNRTLLVRTQQCHRSEPIRRFATQGRHLDVVARLLGPDVCLTHQQTITKLPDDPSTTSEIAFHQDNGYGRLEPPTDVTVWVALHDTYEANGCLRVIPGSHRLGVLPHEQSGVNPFLFEADAAVTDAVPVPLRAGEAVAFTGQTLHASGPNRTDRARVGFFVRYCEPGVRMLSEGGRPVLEDPHSWMVRGAASRS